VATPSDVLLADGTIGVIRSLRADDHDGVLALHESVSEDTLRLRFFTVSRQAGRQYVERLFDPAHTEQFALVALVQGRLAGLATADLESDERAEVAFLVSDQDHGRGLGSLLLEHLAALGRDHGLTRFDATVLAHNYGMLRVFRSAGFAISRRTEDGEVSVELRTDVSAAALDASDRREWRAEARSLRPLLAPESIALVGVRRAAGGVGRAVLDSIIAGGYGGRVSVVHPAAESEGGQIAGIPAYADIAEVPGPLDLVLVALPSTQVGPVIERACKAGAGAVVVVSAGFQLDGPVPERGLVELARSHGVRLIGPNSQGVICLGGTTSLNASVARTLPARGGFAFASQSGGVGFTVIDLVSDLGVGVHSFVSLGAKLDVSSNDLLAAWGDDDEVTVAALYLESFGNALKFARTARRFAARKPLLAVVGGDRGVRGSVGIAALFAQAGVIRCTGIAELSETAAVLSQQPLPEGHRLGIVTNAGGLGWLTASLAEEQGLNVTDSVDVGADVSPDMLGSALRTLLESDEVDAVVVPLAPTVLVDPPRLRAAVAAASAGSGKPVVVVASDYRGDDPVAGLTVFRTPRAAVLALARAMRYAAWRRVSATDELTVDADRAAAARAWATERLASRGGEPEWLPAEGESAVLAPYGIDQVGELVLEAAAAESAAESMGWPVVVKVSDPDVLHKFDRGLVRVGVRSADELASALEAFSTELGTPLHRLEVDVQPVVSGTELAVSMIRDHTYGPLVRVAAGGVASDELSDEVHLLAPVSPSDAARAIRSLRVWPLLDGVHGLERVDIAALEALVVAVGQLAVDVPQVAHVDLNPVVARPDGAYCVDVKVLLSPAEAPDTGFPRRLRPS
jgi:acyl-CoA synthetase (NDP forming)/GNAT superfamily N-acetyltransferase